jgi:hypothetical protein
MKNLSLFATAINDHAKLRRSCPSTTSLPEDEALPLDS